MIPFDVTSTWPLANLEDLIAVGQDINAQTQITYNHGPKEQELAQVCCVMEEAGEFISAYRRYQGWARRSGTEAEIALELADVIISSFTCAAALHIDIVKALRDKLTTVYERGWKETPNT